MSPLEDPDLQDFRHRCQTCLQQPPAYLVVWSDEEEWRCDFCFETDMLHIARDAEAIYYLPTCAQVRLTVEDF